MRKPSTDWCAPRIWWAASAAALAVAGCSSGAKPPPPASGTFVLPSAAASLTPAMYMTIAGDVALYAVRASEILLERSTDGRTRAAASRIIADQKAVASQLSMAGRRVELLPDAALPELLEAELGELQRSADVDRAYRQQMERALSGALEAHETFARAGSSATLRPVAQMAAPVTRRNLEAVRR